MKQQWSFFANQHYTCAKATTLTHHSRKGRPTELKRIRKHRLPPPRQIPLLIPPHIPQLTTRRINTARLLPRNRQIHRREDQYEGIVKQSVIDKQKEVRGAETPAEVFGNDAIDVETAGGGGGGVGIVGGEVGAGTAEFGAEFLEGEDAVVGLLGGGMGWLRL